MDIAEAWASVTAVTPEITFEPETHTYTVSGPVGTSAGIAHRGYVVRSVTQVLEYAGISDFSGVPPEILWDAQQRGTMVHRCCHFLNQRNLDPATVDERIAGYVEAWKAFRRDKQLVVRHSEHLVYRRLTMHGGDSIVPQSTDLEIIGTLDVEGAITRMAEVVIDIKTGDETDAWAVQLAAYVRAFSRRAQYTHKRMVTQLDRGGTYKLHHYKMAHFARDLERFRSALLSAKREEMAAV